MERKITSEETNQLFSFCHKHYVYHYDLQVELVDHLASAIEEQWENNPDLAFEQALRSSFGKFGITGFSKIKEQKRKELGKKYNRLLWNYLLDFFSWPKIVMTLAFTLVLTTIFKIVQNGFWVIVPYFGALLVFIIYYIFWIFPRRFKIDKVNGKKFLLLERLQSVQLITGMFIQIPLQIPNWINISNEFLINNNIVIMGISLLIVLFTIALFGEMFYVPKEIKEHFNQQFPEFAV